MKYDLEERVAKFGEAIIDFAKSLQPNIINKPLISQLIKSATSIGANYMEANQRVLKEILEIKSKFAEKRRMKQNTG
jgi:four helix bundle protein